MKVWGKEVKYCRECNYCSDGNVCSYTGEYQQYSFEEIDKDCPFSKPITKEVIEKFGFKEFSKNCYKNGGIELIVHEQYIGVDDGNYEVLYYISNPEELRFILTSLGIIE